ncbi:Tn3 family transposase, partial [Klebsiella quasipneumoniae subsp. similipneumoniae]|uniref:Tn3 family transposase n=1 Tax=Klebsiella quasipneumoniae TaxID=1463165 RepID=UPI003005D340
MPRRQILSSEEQERLLVIPDDEIILTRMCFLNEPDIALINKHRRPANRLGFAVLLCYLRGPGFIPDKSSAPHNGVVSRVASRLKLQPDLWPEYASREQTRWEHLTELYRYLELSPFSRSMQKDCIRHLHPYAMRTDKGFMLAEEMLSWLHNNNVIFPSVEVIERTLAEVVTLANRSVFSTLTAQLEKQHKSALDSLLISEGEQPSRLALLLQPPGKINGKNVLQHIDRLNSIAALGLPDGIALSVHQNRLLKLAREGRKMSSRDLAKFTDVRRYATLVCIITEARATLTDEVIDLHERILGSLFSRAKRTQAERLQQTGKLIQSKLKQYVTVGQALLNARESGEDPWTAIEDVLPWQEFINSVEETRFLSRKGNFDALHLITEKYSTLRKYAPRMLSALQFMATPAAQALSDALDTITEMYRKQLRKVPPSAPTGFIPESWRKLVLTPSGIDRKYYEFCVLNELKGALRSGDIWVKGSRRYKNFDDYLIPTAEFEKSRHNDQLQLAVQTDSQAYLQARMTLLASRLEEVNAMALAGDLPDVDISDKGVKITPLENSVPSGVSPFAGLVYGMLPHPKITEILEEVDSWTGFTRHFAHLKNNGTVAKLAMRQPFVLFKGLTFQKLCLP